MSRVELAKIPSLTLYKDEYTTGQRTSPVPQLVCVGKPCRLYQPDVVRCLNVGGVRTEVDWKCEADLPDSLRFGKVTVSCEGYSRPGDPYVLKGSCSLEYRLVQIPDSFRNTDSPSFKINSYDWGDILFSAIWLGFLILLLYSFFKSCFRNQTNNRATGPRPPSNNPRGSPSGWFPGGYNDDTSGPPPPYTKAPQYGEGQWGWQNWRPGFWTGAAMGGLANHLWNRPPAQPARTVSYDWERRTNQPRSSFFGLGNSYRRPTQYDNDRGEGTSNLGTMRRSTGLGGSNVR